MTDLILLSRHMSRKEFGVVMDGARAAEPIELDAVADVLAETLSHDMIALTAVRHAPSCIARATAERLAAKFEPVFAPQEISIHLDLNPAHFSQWHKRDDVKRLVRELVDVIREKDVPHFWKGRAILVVGHMPQLGWLAEHLLRTQPLWTRISDGGVPPVALELAEVAAIALPSHDQPGPNHARKREREPDHARERERELCRGHLEWTVAPDQTRAIEDLREKIRSKMDIAKLLGGFMTLVLGGVVLAPGRLAELSRGGHRWAVYVAAVSFLIAIGLYLRTMYAYDSLLMPTRFWAQSFGRRQPRWLVRRPPSSAAWILYQNMLHVWTFLFTPATIAVVIGLLALAYASLKPGWVDGLAAFMVLAGVAIYALRHGPVLGSQD
jgi:hypothetical protein